MDIKEKGILMVTSLAVCIITCALMILSVLFFPKLKIGRFAIDTYWLVTLSGALFLVILGQINLADIKGALFADTAVNPVKILVLFISMTVLSVFLDELGFFAYLANKALGMAGKSQNKLFFLLYITVSVLTVFTSNDIIILTFTPFICYFAKNANISPIPYLVAQFVAANTWSMMLIIGNPTNIYLASSYGVDFISYLKIMLLPTVACGLTSLFVLWIMFRKKLSLPMTPEVMKVKIKDKLMLTVGLLHLSVCTVALAIGSYVGAPMWLIALLCALSLFVCVGAICAVKRKPPVELALCVRRAPWQLIPFIISMFILILSLSGHGITQNISTALQGANTAYGYGISSFLASNVINNIPMSVLFSSIIESAPQVQQTCALYASVIGSNLGALFTPIGALAGIMWTMILKNRGIKFGYIDFVKYVGAASIPAFAAALTVLNFII